MQSLPKRAVLLISSGIDSPVAGYLMLRQGVELVAVHFQNSESTNPSTADALRALVKRLSAFSKVPIPLIIVPNYQNESLISGTNRRFQCVLCKRMMYRVAERIALDRGCSYLVTGENIGQVASQTLDNLAVLDDAIALPVLRPLLCNDKTETIRLAEQIGTFGLSIKGTKCPFLPSNPLTCAKLEDVQGEETRLDIRKLTDDSVAGSSLIRP